MDQTPGNFDNYPRFAVLTPPGRGAVATIAVRGDRALTTIGQRFCALTGRSLDDCEVARVVYGRFRSSAATEEDVVVEIVAEDEAEIHCRGGEAGARAICDALADAGGKSLTAQNWIDETTA